MPIGSYLSSQKNDEASKAIATWVIFLAMSLAALTLVMMTRHALLIASAGVFLMAIVLYCLTKLTKLVYKKQVLKEKILFFQDLTKHSQNPEILLDTAGAILAFNPAASKWGGGDISKTQEAFREKLAAPDRLAVLCNRAKDQQRTVIEAFETRSELILAQARPLEGAEFHLKLTHSHRQPAIGWAIFDNKDQLLEHAIGSKYSKGDYQKAYALCKEGKQVAPSLPTHKIPFFLLFEKMENGQIFLRLFPLEGLGSKDNKPLAEHEMDVFEMLPVPLVHLSQNGQVNKANKAARKVLRITETEIVPNISDLMEGLGRSLTDWLGQAIKSNDPSQPEFLRVARDERDTFIQVVLNRADLGKKVGLIAVLTDATELKTLEARIVQSQKMQAIGQLAGGVAHDFNNLLTAISGHCDLLLLRHDPGDLDFDDLMQINHNANRAAALVSQLLAFSRKQTLRPETIDVRDTLADLTHLLNRLVGEKIRLTLNHDPCLSSIRADKRQLEQVLMNLVVNARDAMPHGGAIEIKTSNITLTEPLHRNRAIIQPGDYVCLNVTDQGIGIAPEMQKKIFEPFYTTKRTGEGTGLGLSTVYGIVKQTGGFIFVDSARQKGSVFTLYFPAHAPRSLPEPPRAKPKQLLDTSPQNHVVLLVEDETPVRTFAARALQMRGFTVIEACSAEEALERLEDDTIKIDVFVTDVVMPGLDGPSWVKEALIDRPDVRVVFMSGYAEESFSDQQAMIQNSVFLPKPFSLTDLTRTVEQQVAAAA